MKILLALLLVLIVSAGGYLLLWPVPIDPVAWDAPRAPAGGSGHDDQLAAVEWLARGAAIGPEDVAVDTRGRIYGGFADGSIRRFAPDGSAGEVLVDTGGRPLGLAWAPAGSLVIADAMRGLLVLREDGSLRVLARGANGTPFGFADDVDVAADGTIYFSDASSKFGYHEVFAAMLEHGGHGRLLKYEPIADRVTVLLDGLQFANGVAVGPDERYVLVNETGAYRITRYWLQGPKAGTSEVWVDNLTGFPDGISFNGKDLFWVALYAPRNAMLDAMSDQPWLRKIVYRLPEFLQPAAAHRAHVLGLALDGSVVHDLQDAGKHAFAPVTSVQQVGDMLYLGSLSQPAIARIPVPE